MKMNLSRWLLLLVLLLAGGASAVAQEGRFVVAAGQIESVQGKKSVVLKIDTVTGETWQLYELPVVISAKSPGGTMMGWVHLPADLMAEIEKFQAAMKKKK